MQIRLYRQYLTVKLTHKFHVYDYHWTTFLDASPNGWADLANREGVVLMTQILSTK
jgi:hypothetical protein